MESLSTRADLLVVANTALSGKLEQKVLINLVQALVVKLDKAHAFASVLQESPIFAPLGRSLTEMLAK